MELLTLIDELNNRKDVNGILVQLPVPAHINEKHIIEAIHPLKDVDGFHPRNVGALVTGEDGFVSCTPAGIIQLLKRSNIDIDGKECVVVGRSNIVGKPMAILLLRNHLSFPHKGLKGSRQTCRYSCCCYRQAEILQPRLY